MGGSLWQTWSESKSGEDGGGRNKTGRDDFVYLGVVVCGDGGMGIRRRIQAVANVWRNVEGVMTDTYVS